jgi:hypothetical protein
MTTARLSPNHRQRRYIREAILSRRWLLRKRPDVAKRIKAKVKREERAGLRQVEVTTGG